MAVAILLFSPLISRYRFGVIFCCCCCIGLGNSDPNKAVAAHIISCTCDNNLDASSHFSLRGAGVMLIHNTHTHVFYAHTAWRPRGRLFRSGTWRRKKRRRATPPSSETR